VTVPGPQVAVRVSAVAASSGRYDLTLGSPAEQWFD